MKTEFKTRLALDTDLESILTIYNQGIEDRIATLEAETKDIEYMKNWFHDHSERFAVISWKKIMKLLAGHPSIHIHIDVLTDL
jgi:L-amino acid N-acyltransferase YncA